MRHADVPLYRNPKTGQPLQVATPVDPGAILDEGTLREGGDEYAVVGGIPRFCPRENYAESFGFQWNKFDTVQLDSGSTWGQVSHDRLFAQTEWSKDLRGQRIMEAGCGMGRFTEHLVATGADVWSFDYSRAVEANARNASKATGSIPDNLHLAQGDIFAPPYAPASFDKVLCIGVIQHTPDPAKAFESLVRFVKPGGEIVIDCYRLDWQSFFLGKYWLRPLTKRVPPQRLHPLVAGYVRAVYPVTGAAQKVLGRNGRRLSWMLGMADYRGVFQADDKTLRELSELDTFDMLAPAHDHPQTLATVEQWYRQAGLQDIRVRKGWNGVEAKGVKPLS